MYQASQPGERLFVLAVSIYAFVFLRFFYKMLELFQQCGFSFSSPLPDGCDYIATMNRLNLATFMFLSQARIYDPIGLYHGRLSVLPASIFASVFLRFFYKILELFQKCGFSFSSPLRNGCDYIATMNRFIPATIMLLSQARIYNSIGLYRGGLCVLPASIFASVFPRFFFYIWNFSNSMVFHF